jgi:pimeloyl-ACP methyl ester carboxylesterase
VAVKYFTVESVATFVHHRGPTTLPGRPPAPAGGETVLCVHDVAGNGNVFADVLDALNPRHRPIAFDLPAHGRSGSLDSLGSIAEMAAYTKEVGDRLELTAPVLLGDGMGAAIALEAAARWPDWPAALVVCASGAIRPSPDDIEQVRLVTAGRARRQFDSTGYAPDTSRDVYQRAFAEWMKTDPRATLGDLQALAAWDGTGRVSAVTAPVVVVVGEHEPAEARASADALAATAKNGRVVSLPGAGRRGVVEQPAALAVIVNTVAEGAPA